MFIYDNNDNDNNNDNNHNNNSFSTVSLNNADDLLSWLCLLCLKKPRAVCLNLLKQASATSDAMLFASFFN